jgi:hypothetical protein
MITIEQWQDVCKILRQARINHILYYKNIEVVAVFLENIVHLKNNKILNYNDFISKTAALNSFKWIEEHSCLELL